VGTDGAHFPVYQVLLRGPTKIEYLFLDHEQQPTPTATPSETTLAAIDTHFWDWIWWLATKAHIGRDDLVSEHLPQLYGHLLRPVRCRVSATRPRVQPAAPRTPAIDSRM